MEAQKESAVRVQDAPTSRTNVPPLVFAREVWGRTGGAELKKLKKLGRWTLELGRGEECSK